MKSIIFLIYLSFTIGNIPFHENAICYGPFRDGQSPGKINPTKNELKEDLLILDKRWSTFRMYGSQGSTEIVLNIIKENNLNIKLYLGAWIATENKDSTIIETNLNELNKTIELANKYPKIVEAIIIGNETQVFWSWNKVDFNTLIKYIKYVKSNTSQPITTADDFNFWNKAEGKHLAKTVDFIMVHIHPLWAGTSLSDAVSFTSRIFHEIQEIHPNKKIIIGETGWATSVHNQGEQAKLIKGQTGIIEQYNFYRDIMAWSIKNKVTTFFFEAFDEKWKGGDHPNEVEKHWGLYYSNRTPKSEIK